MDCVSSYINGERPRTWGNCGYCDYCKQTRIKSVVLSVWATPNLNQKITSKSEYSSMLRKARENGKTTLYIPLTENYGRLITDLEFGESIPLDELVDFVKIVKDSLDDGTGRVVYHSQSGISPRLMLNEAIKIDIHNERARRKGLVSDLNVLQWIDVLNHFNFKCAYCGDKYKELDHVISVSIGGGTTIGNVMPSCVNCNHSKSNKINLRHMAITMENLDALNRIKGLKRDILSEYESYLTNDKFIQVIS